MILLYYLPLSVFHYNVIRFICIVFCNYAASPYIYIFLSINLMDTNMCPFISAYCSLLSCPFSLFSSSSSFFSPVLISYIIIFIYRNYKILQSYNENTIYHKIEIKKKRNTKTLKPRNNKKS